MNNSEVKTSSGFTGVHTVPAILSCSELSSDGKFVLSIIYNFKNGKGFFMGNEHLSKIMGWKLRKTVKVIGDLKDNGWISIVAAQSRYRKIYPTSKTFDLVDGNYAQTHAVDDDLLRANAPSKHNSTTRISDDYYAQTDLVTTRKDAELLRANAPTYNKGYTKGYTKDIIKPDCSSFDFEGIADDEKVKPMYPKGFEIEQFERCWKAYGNHGTKSRALKYWQKLSQSDRDAIEKKIAAYVAFKSEMQFRKHFDGWINPENRIWENIIPTQNPDQKLKAGQVKSNGHTVGKF